MELKERLWASKMYPLLMLPSDGFGNSCGMDSRRMVMVICVIQRSSLVVYPPVKELCKS